MSIKVMNAVWQYAPIPDPRTLLTLLALADWANDQGLCWPSMATLAKKSRQSVRNARYVLKRLEREGLVEIIARRGRNHVNRYRINLQRLQGSDVMVQPGVENLQPSASKPATVIADNPSVNHQEIATTRAVQSLAVLYRSLFGLSKEQWTLTPLRRRKAMERLREFEKSTGSLHEATNLMTEAIRGLRRSPFHNGQNEHATRYISWEKHLFATREATERWIQPQKKREHRSVLDEVRAQRRG